MITLSWFTLLMIIGAIQGLFLIVILIFRNSKQVAANKYLILLIGFIFWSLILRLFYDEELYLKYPHVSEAGDFVMFAFGPTLLVYIKSLLYKDFKPNSNYLLHFVPLLLFLVVLGYIFSIDKQTFISMNGSPMIRLYYTILLGIAIVQNGIYILISLKEVTSYKKQFYTQHSEDHKVQYLLVILSIMLACIILWAMAFATSIFTAVNINIVNLHYTIAFLGLASLSFVISLYAINNPAIFQVVQENNMQKYRHSSLVREDMDDISKRLERSLAKEKLYKDPKLSLSKLAAATNTNQVHLSRVINESYNKNFFDLVNEYRIKDFISKVLSEDYKNYTYLGIALESGFNTKVTFNKAFKKITSVTPREFFKNSDQMIKEL